MPYKDPEKKREHNRKWRAAHREHNRRWHWGVRRAALIARIEHLEEVLYGKTQNTD